MYVECSNCRWADKPVDATTARHAVLTALMHNDAISVDAQRVKDCPPPTPTENAESADMGRSVSSDVSDALFSYMTDENVPTTNITEMLSSYLAAPCSSLEPLLYWKDEANQRSFPSLYMLHLKHHCIPATSANVERVFSAAGYIVSARRNRLGDESIESLVFAKCNKDLLFRIK